MAAEAFEFTWRQFATLANRKPTSPTTAQLSGAGETGAPTTATITIVGTPGDTPADTAFTIDYAVT